jgi:hypothetical protein
MYEIVPLVAGVVFACGWVRWGPVAARPRLLISVLFALATGVVAASISGELAESWIFIVIDAAATMAAIVVTTVVLSQLGWRGERR